jgi:putative ABC transport system permease protein
MVPLKERIVGNIRLPLLVLLVGVCVVLLVACANIANLVLSGAAIRTREISLRLCLGASRMRIVRQLITESLLLATLGGVCGLLLASWGVVVLRKLLAGQVPLIESARLSPKVLLFTFAVSLLTGILFGIAPALRGARLNLQDGVKEGARGSTSRHSRKLGDAFVMSQIAMSLILLIGAGLIVRSFRNLISVDPGFAAQNVLSASLSLPQSRYTNETHVRSFYSQLLERAQQVPGVETAALCQVVPFSGGGGGYAFTVERYQPKAGEPARDAWRRSVTPDYFTTLGIRVLKGRQFETTDREDSPLVAMVDEKLAREYWSDGNPVGKRIRLGGPTSKAPWLTIVGVVRSVKNRRLDEDAKFYVYQPFFQWAPRESSLVMRTSVDPESITASLRNEVATLDPELPLFDITTVEDSVARSVATKRFASGLLMAFASTALLLAIIGVYGVISLNVNSRTNEFGIRLALGAQPRNVLQLVLGQGMPVAALGIVIGIIAALSLTRLLENLLFGVTPTDPLTFVVVTGTLVVAALAASYIPARRATKVDPLVALRYE